MKKIVLAALITFYPTLAWSKTCTVTSIPDGDSMHMHCAGQKQTTVVRLIKIDAPELRQAYGKRSRDYLQFICPPGTKAVIEGDRQDRYKRTLAQVMCGGINANTAMIKSGHAWVNAPYVSEQTLYELQDEARAKHMGLWSRRDAIAPWEFRKTR